MAVQVILEFTDAQWDLILEYYGIRFDGASGELIGVSNEADFIVELKRRLTAEIEQGMVNKAQTEALKASKGVFDA